MEYFCVYFAVIRSGLYAESFKFFCSFVYHLMSALKMPSSKENLKNNLFYRVGTVHCKLTNSKVHPIYLRIYIFFRKGQRLKKHKEKLGYERYVNKKVI